MFLREVLINTFELAFDGTAWLSSVRVVECNIKLFYERNLQYESNLRSFIKDTRLKNTV